MYSGRDAIIFIISGIALAGLGFLHASLIWNSPNFYDGWLIAAEIILIVALAVSAARAMGQPVFYLAGAIAVFVMLFFAISIMPTYAVSAKDVFGEPLPGLEAVVIENLGEKHGVPGAEAIILRKEILRTDENGRIEVPGKIYFGFRKPENLILSLNRAPMDPQAAAEADLLVNRKWDGKEITLKEVNSVILSPLKIDYQTCFALADPEARSECLPYALFYSAVEEVDTSYCKRFEFDEERHSLEFFSHRENFSRPFELQYECTTFVGGVLKRSPSICATELDMEMRKFKAECTSLMNPSDTGYCGAQDTKECVKRKAQFLKNPRAYLCEKNGGEYANPALGVLRHASLLYREMFCE